MSVIEAVGLGSKSRHVEPFVFAARGFTPSPDYAGLRQKVK
jgi:hypothetical protein